MGEESYRKITSIIILGVILLLTFLLLKPILISIIIGVLLAFILFPAYNWILKKTHSRNVAAGIICLMIILVLVIPFWFLTPIFIDQSFQFYLSYKQMDLVSPIKQIFPSFFSTPELSAQASSVITSMASKAMSSLISGVSKLILEAPAISLHLLVIFFTLFFVLRDNEKTVNYLRTILPFSRDVERKLFESSKEITLSILYGQVIIGVVQGLIAGLGFILFSVPNAILLTLLASLSGILPVIGTAIIWIPVALFMFVSGSTGPAIGVLVFGLISSSIDNILRPMIVSKWSKMHPLIALLGMIGGVFFLGIIGFILGPLILAYLLIILELYRDKKRELF